MTAPMAIVIVNGVAIGKMRDIRVRETFNRGRVIGLGQLLLDELPILGWQGTLSAQFFLADLRRIFPNPDTSLHDPVRRDTGTDTAFADTLILQEQIQGGIQIDIMRRVAGTIDNGIVRDTNLETVASIRHAYLTSDAFNFTEGQISLRDVEFEYARPILFPLATP